MIKVAVKAKSHSYDIFLGEGCVGLLAEERF